MFPAARNAFRLSAAAPFSRPACRVFAAASAAAAGRRPLTTTEPRRLAAADGKEKPSVHITFHGDGGSDAQASSSAPAAAGAASPAVPTLSASAHAALPPTMQALSLFGKTVVITGGARGLGNHMARACAEAGARAVVIFDANAELGDAAAAELHRRSGARVSFCKIDVRDERAIAAAVDAVVDRWGAPDVLVNAAGIADSNIKAEEYEPSMFRRLIDINLTGTFLMSAAVGRAMMAAKKPGSIVLVASMSGSIVNFPQEQSCYNASKAGVIQFAKSIAAEWAKHKIRVNCISPGYMDTELNRVGGLEAQKRVWVGRTPQMRLGDVHELNGLCVYLASDASAFMTGSNLIIDGGYTCW